MPFNARSPASSAAAKQPAARRLNILTLIGVIFFTVSGGAYGLEPLVGAVGAGWAVVLVIVTPLVWSLPIVLMVAELSSALPEEGGYYVWVREGLGDFWAVQEGWWTLCYSAVDMAIYPVLFVTYLAYFFPSLALSETGSTQWQVLLVRWLVAVAVIATALMVNWRGAQSVGHTAVLNAGLVLLPFLALTIIGLGVRDGAVGTAFDVIRRDLATEMDTGLLALGLSTVLWNYCGWDNVSTFAGEVNDPQRAYPRALLAASLLVLTAYLLPLLAGISVTTADQTMWSETAGWPVIAQAIGGHRFGMIVAGAALVSAWSLFSSQLLYVSRVPFAMAQDGWLPAALMRISEKTGVPVTSLTAMCVVAAIFAVLPFGKLVVIDVLLYAAALSLEFAALIALRLKRPGMLRPFRIPGSWFGIAFVATAPLCCAAIVAVASLGEAGAATQQLWVVLAMLASGTVLYFARRHHHHNHQHATNPSQRQ